MSGALRSHQQNWNRMQANTFTAVEQRADESAMQNQTALRGQDLAMDKAKMDDATTRRWQNAAYGLKRMDLGAQNPLLAGGISSMRSALDSDMFGQSVTPTVQPTFGMQSGSIGGWNTSITGSSLLNERGFARGGPVNGPGPVGVDSVPARLAPGEYVLPPETAQALGGPRTLNQIVRSTTGREPGATIHHDGRQGLARGGPPLETPNGYAITKQGSEQTRMLNEQGMNNTLAVSPGAFRDAQVLHERSNEAPVDTRQTGIPQVASNVLPGSTARGEQSQRPMSISKAARALTQQATSPRAEPTLATPPPQGDYNFQVVPEGTISPLGTPTEMAVDEAKRLSANARNVYNSESPILRRGNVFTDDPTWQPYVENAGATQSLGAAYTGEPRKPREPTARDRMEQNIRFQPYEVQVAMRAQFDQREQEQAHERAQQQLVNDSYIANTRASFENPATMAQAALAQEQLTGLRELREREARERAKQPTREAILRAGGTETLAEEALLAQNPAHAAQAEAARRQMEAANLKRAGWGNDPRPGQVDPATMRYTGRENRGFWPWLGQAVGWAVDAPGYGQVEVMDDLGNTYWTDLDDPIMETMRQRSIRSATR